MIYAKLKFFRIFLLFSLYAAQLVFYSCDAPRDNPFDPNADNYKPKTEPVVTTIRINNLYPPYRGLSGISVFAPANNFFGQTGPDGSVSWVHDPLDSVKLYAQGDGFFERDSLYKNLTENSLINLYLNAKPYLRDIKFTSRYDNYSGLSFLQYRSRVIDPDGVTDLKTVLLVCPEYNFKDTLALENAGTDIFTTKDFNIQEIDSQMTAGMVPELSFSLIVQNTNGDSLVFEPFSIVRVIEQSLEQTAPQENDIITGPVTFQWKKVELDFSFTFSILLYQLPSTELIATYNDIPADSTAFTIDPLANGRYLWVLELKDSAGNASQSSAIIFTSEN